MRKKICSFCFLIFSVFCVFGESEEIKDEQNEINLEKSKDNEQKQKSFANKSIFSFDLGYLGTGIKNNGWGLGLSYEHSIFNYSAIKGSFSHMTMYPKEIDSLVTTVGIKLEGLFYPFGSGLDKLYIGFGGGSDFLMYDRKDENGKSENDVVITIYPEIGWKQNFFDYVMVDVFFGYRILLNEPSLLSYQADLVDSGIKYGVRVKFNIVKIWKWIFRK